MDADERISLPARENIKDAIFEAGGNEVMAVGHLNNQKIVTSLNVTARGDDVSVPALFPYMEKGDVVIHNHPTGKLKPSQADLSIASRLGQEGIGFYIVDNAVEEIYVVAEPVFLEELKLLDPEKLVSILGPDGLMSQLINYEARDSQLDMLRQIAHGYNDEIIIAAEAGTGVGKSFAYLIPSMAWAEQNNERIVVSTATINLQQQLIEKDIPLVQKVLGGKIKAVLVKGRGNYVCRRRLSEALEEDSLFRDESDHLMQIGGWVDESPTGSKTDLPFLPNEEVWNGICSESDGCLGLRCTQREKCFVLKARKEAASARLLVVNHHLLFSDLSLRLSGAGFENTAVLPPFNRIVFDEAHNIEKSATSFFSRELSRFSINRILYRLFHRRGTYNQGVWVNLQKLATPAEGESEVPSLIREIQDKMQVLEDASMELLNGEYTYRLKDGSDKGALSASLLGPMQSLQDYILRCTEALQKTIERVGEEFSEETAVWESRMLLNRMMALSSVCESFKEWEEKREEIFWFEKGRTRKGDEFIRFVATPLNISGVMRDAVFEPYDTVVCTSATMSVKDSFNYWARRTGVSDLVEREVRTFRFPSPFPYKENVLLGIPTDAPEPNNPDYTSYIAEMVKETLLISEGHGLVLFTSYSQLREVWEITAPFLRAQGIPVLRQGDDHRAKLLDDFNANSASVLFATSSFWEGVDSPGDSLQVVIICKLPFQVPTDPVIAARREQLEKRGGNAFMELFVPEAVMRLKQGFGRLMRRTTDRGVVLILDPRIIRKSYGSLFLGSLPMTGRSIKEKSGVLVDVENFLYP
ncbi:MAG: helicase c2 [Spirochaetales bacterium]|nr:helicase c2 [Spirochaetales bacterium]